MTDITQMALDKFFEFYKNDVESEVIDSVNVVLSFPFHLTGYHRIEITVTSVNPDTFIISDGAKTFEELRLAGYVINKRLRERIEFVSRAARVRVVNRHLVTDCDLKDLGASIQRFLEAVKTIGDAYLVQRVSVPRDKQIFNEIRDFLSTQEAPYQTRHPLKGEFEPHVIDFYFPPNGVPGLALSVVNNPSKLVTDAWGYRSQDIKKNNERMKVGVVYDDSEISDNSKSLLVGMMDVSLPSSKITELGGSLKRLGIIH